MKSRGAVLLKTCSSIWRVGYLQFVGCGVAQSTFILPATDEIPKNSADNFSSTVAANGAYSLKRKRGQYARRSKKQIRRLVF